MSSLLGKTLVSTWTALLKLKDDTQTLLAGGSTAVQVRTGKDEETPLYLNTDRLGIGTSSPEGVLHVAASGSLYPDVKIESTTDHDVSLMLEAGSSNNQFAFTVRDEIDRLDINSDTVNPMMSFLDNGNVGIGITSPIAIIHTVSENAISAFTDRYDSSVSPNLIMRRSLGTKAEPSAVGNDNHLFTVSGRGYGSTGFANGGRVAIVGSAAEAWTDSAQGTFMALYTTETGSTSSLERVRIDGVGNVGIGTTSPDDARLDVLVTDDDRYVKFRAPNGEDRFKFYAGGTGNASNLQMYTSDGVSNTIKLSSGGNSWFNGGNVGIGDTDPQERLDIGGGNMRFGGSGSGGFTLDNTSGSPDAGFLRWGDSTGWKFHFARYSESIGGDKNTGTTGSVMTINSGSGNVGIGTTAPLRQLQVASTNTSQADSNQGCFAFAATSNYGSLSTIFSHRQDGNAIVVNESGVDLDFRVESDNKDHALFVRGSDGNVGIGENSPDYPLEVKGIVKIKSPIIRGTQSRTIASGTIDITSGGLIIVSAESGGVDDLDFITVNDTIPVSGTEIFLTRAGGDAITLRAGNHGSVLDANTCMRIYGNASGGTVPTYISGAMTSGYYVIHLIYTSSRWNVLNASMLATLTT